TVTDSFSSSTSSSSSSNQKKIYTQVAESTVSQPASSKPAQNSEKTEKNITQISVHRKKKRK
ncbi:hypothetical protein BDDG_13281, partial [Blastomyces dermatitidis ATCC 18188]